MDVTSTARILDVAVGDLTTAYAVKSALTALRIGRGGRLVGWKLGYTTVASGPATS